MTTITTDADWRTRAACRTTSGALDRAIFPSVAYAGPRRALRLETAAFIRDYCRTCPVMKECGRAGRGQRFGVWGGRWRG